MIAYVELPYLEHPEVVHAIIQKITSRLLTAEQSIGIFAGTAYWIIFSHPYIKDALKKKQRSGVKINVVAGPVLSVWPDGPDLEGKSSGILDLAESGAISLYCREKMASPHFIAIDNRVVLLESEHVPLAALLSRKVNSLEKGAEGFERCLAQFQRAVETLRPSQNPRGDFILLTPSRIDAIQSQYNFGELTRNDLLGILKSTPDWKWDDFLRNRMYY